MVYHFGIFIWLQHQSPLHWNIYSINVWDNHLCQNNGRQQKYQFRRLQNQWLVRTIARSLWRRFHQSYSRRPSCVSFFTLSWFKIRVEPSMMISYAFRPTGSITATLINLVKDISDLLIVYPYVHLITFDISKAFDSIQHRTLTDKLANLPIPDTAYN